MYLAIISHFSPPHFTFMNLVWQDILGSDGVLLLPIYTMQPPYHNELNLFLSDVSFLHIFNATEMPATAVPLGLSKDGLPLALQVVLQQFKLYFHSGKQMCVRGWRGSNCIT